MKTYYKIIIIACVITLISCVSKQELQPEAEKRTPRNISLTSSVSKRELQPEAEKRTPRNTYLEFTSALAEVDVDKVNDLLGGTCEFKEYMPNWYSLYRDNKNIIGPFSKEDFRDENPLNLVRPNGYSEEDFTRFHVFGKHYDLYLSFSNKTVFIEGTGNARGMPTEITRNPNRVGGGF